MTCQQVRAALSADIDGEGGPLPSVVLAHLDGCSRCTEWRDLAHAVTRATRLSAAVPAADLPQRLVAGVRADARQRRIRRSWVAVFTGVVAVGAVQVAATVPLLVLARGAAGAHPAGRVLGIAEAAIGAAFFIGAVIVLWCARDSSTLHVIEADERSDDERVPVSRGQVA